MKKLLPILILICAGCQDTKLNVGSASYNGKSLFYPRKFTSLTLTTTDTNGVTSSLIIKGYSTQQAELAGALAEGAVKGAIASQGGK